MNARRLTRMLAVAASLFAASAAWGQVPPYGANVTLEQAKKAMAAAEAEARKNSWRVAIAIVDTAGNLVMYQRLDDTQTGSVQIAIDKAASSAMYRRPTKAFQDELQRGGDGLRVLTFPKSSHADGGVPIVADGKIIGGIGASGVLGNQDAVVAAAGAAALK